MSKALRDRLFARLEVRHDMTRPWHGHGLLSWRNGGAKLSVVYIVLFIALCVAIVHSQLLSDHPRVFRFVFTLLRAT